MNYTDYKEIEEHINRLTKSNSNNSTRSQATSVALSFEKIYTELKRVPDNERLGIDIELSPYDENEKRVIGGKIVNVTWHTIDWKKNFAVGHKENK